MVEYRKKNGRSKQRRCERDTSMKSRIKPLFKGVVHSLKFASSIVRPNLAIFWELLSGVKWLDVGRTGWATWATFFVSSLRTKQR